jgi:uncharacterized DUF497 family protein
MRDQEFEWDDNKNRENLKRLITARIATKTEEKIYNDRNIET